ncbi:MAG TPA: TonB-dependent receptor [Gemmatimonadales bacterium]|nr:TonB-dependent receptor [Gemmatimonadales bacterium]
MRSIPFPYLARALVFLALVAAPRTAHSTPAPKVSGRVAAVGGAPAAIPATGVGDISGAVTDSVTGKPLPGGEVRIVQRGNVVATTTTDAFGEFIVHNLAAGSYTVEVRYLGYRVASREVNLTGAAAQQALAFQMAPIPVNLEAVQVRAEVPLAVDTRTGNQVFKQNDYHGAPSSTASQILQQSIAGAARAPTGEVHIRGQHAEYTYYVDGIPVQSGISGSLNELFDPEVVNQIVFQTGGWDPEFGNKNAAIVNVTTRIPAGGFHADLGAYGGSFTTNGQSLNLSTNAGKWGFFASGTRKVTDMRQEPVAFDTVTNEPFNYHNDGEDLFGFGKIEYVPSAHDVVNLDVNWSRTHFAVPFDSSQGITDAHQQDVNGFVNLGWRHRFAVEQGEGGRASELFAGGFYRNGSLTYTPGVADEPSFVFYPDTTTAYNLSEDRNFNSVGAKLDYLFRPHHGLEFKLGAQGSITRGHEDFETVDSAGNPGPASNSDLNGSDVGAYAQVAISPSDRWELRTGLRFDNHNAPFAGNQNQLSPRVKLSFLADPANTFWVYYGRLFIPTNVEDLRAITSVAQGDTVAEPTLPERDDFFEVGYVHRFSFGVVTKLSGYYKVSKPGIDDNTVPGSSIVTSVNIEEVHTTGIEAVVEVRTRGPFSGYLNFALNHAYGSGAITGGFFPTAPPAGDFDLDHDQRISVAGNAIYAHHGWYLSATGIYGTGLTNGNEDATFGTRLLDFNADGHVAPNFILNASVGYTWVVGSTAIRPQLYVDNLLDNHYLLKGAFFSGASVGRPRSVQFRVSMGV